MQDHANKEEAEKTGMEIAIIGISGRFPGARNIHEFWDNLKKGVESITFFTDQELEDTGIPAEEINNPDYVYVKAKGMLEDIESFDSSFFNYTPKEATIMDPQVRLFHECAWEALEDAGYDSWSYDGLIGLYAGATTNIHWMVNALVFWRNQATSTFENGLLNNSDYLSTRVSYKLNLKGPVVMTNSACSTSLAAVHLAVQALLMGECEIALAGGVTVSLPWKTGYVYNEGMIKSPDGHCRAFDVQAQGFASGNGIGIVVLKRLEEAISDNDHIYAVILGSALNNDGIRRVGYTAPSVEGQAEVIRAAQQMAEVDPQTIGYIETHGTGTNLGDPIEIEALKQAFKQNNGKPLARKQFCALGSVKTNVGHLDSAAGAASLIKTALALKHHLIPPNLNFETPNPRLALEDSPFFINARLTPWNSSPHPLRAGVSSFGIGGTNVHMVLEEAPIAKSTERIAQSEEHMEQSVRSQDRGGVSPPSYSRQYQLILLSAQTKTALDRAAQNLGEYLKQNPAVNLRDVAFTLQKGRKTLNHKRIMVCSQMHEAVEALLSPNGHKSRDHFSKEEDCPVIFMFPGLGSQYVNMGRQLYETQPLFRKEIDRCFELLKPLLDEDIKEILYPSARHYRSNKTNMSYKSNMSHINRIEISQLVVFIFEYALAQLLINWGIKPYAMIGYSFGEYMAACTAGVFSLEDALKLLVSRGKLIHGIPPGAMLSVPLPEEKLKPILGKGLSIAIDNGAACIVTGSNESIDAFEKQMKENRYMCVRLKATHGIHSTMMDSISAGFEEAFSRITLHEPKIPYISNVTGKWITVENATSPQYWVRHLRETVRFARGLEELVKIENAALVEVGPGVVLSTLAVQHIDKKANQLAINLIKAESQNADDMEYLQNKIGRLWLYGKKINWSGFYFDQKRKRVPLPTYPFEGRRYPVDVSHLDDLLKGKMPEVAPLVLPEDKPPETVSAQSEEGYVAPRNKAEQMMANMWEEILGFKPIGIHENFFEMGGDSLKGMVFVNKLQELLEEIIHITVIFDAPTVAQLADYFKENYPKGYTRMMETETEAAQEPEQYEEEVTREKVEHIRGLLPALPPRGKIEEPKNPPALFVLSPPRTGSTLLRVILAGHPRLFAPPELNLLPHDILSDRKTTLSGRAESHLQGTLRAIMQIKQCSVQQAEEMMQDFENQGMTVKQFYGRIQEWLGQQNQVLVDKSPGYSLYRDVLKRAESYFQDPWYIFLLRHPYGMIRSYKEARMDLLMGQQLMDKLFLSRQAMAEMTWTICVLNIMAFLKQIPGNRQLCIKFEDLVANPETVTRDICGFLNLEFHPDMLRPYQEKEKRMTDPVYSGGIMLGDMKFHRHKKIDSAVAETWKSDYTVDFWGEPTRQLAKKFGYKSIRELQKQDLVVEDKNLVLLEKKSPDGKNLFLIHDRSGDVESYIEFCRQLKSDFNCWGIRADRLKNAAPQNWTFKEMAQKYIRKIKRLQAQGPYYLAGWSIGGMVAFEMVKQLEQMGEKIACCVLIDPSGPYTNPGKKMSPFTPETEIRFIKQHFPGIEIKEKLENISNIDDIWPLIIGCLESNPSEVKRIENLAEKYVSLDSTKLKIHQKIEYLNLERTIMKARLDYIPSNEVNTPIYYFWATGAGGINKEHWNEYTTQPIEFYEVPGDHFSMLKRPYVVELAQKFASVLHMEQHRTTRQVYSKLQSAPKAEFYKLSMTQKRVWILNQFESANTTYNAPRAYLLEGKLDREVLEKTFETVINRHESLRTTFVRVKGDPRQKIHDFESIGFKFEYMDLRNREDREEKAGTIARQEARAPFNLEKGPLLRVKLLHMQENNYVLLLTKHHIISDGWSFRVMVYEILTLYDAYKTNRDNPLPPLRFQYKDYSHWQNSGYWQKALNNQEKYWLKEFAGEPPVLDLPADYPRPLPRSSEGSTIKFEVGEAETTALNEIARTEGSSMFMVLLAVLNIFLAKLSNQVDIVVGTPIAGRNNSYLEQIIGMFINTLALRNYPREDKTFREFFREVKTRTLRTFENQDYPFENLVEKVEVGRDISRNPLFDVMFAYQNLPEFAGEIQSSEKKNLVLKPFPMGHTIARFDMLLAGVDMAGKLDFRIEYCTELFKEETISRFISCFKTIISSVTRDPGRKIAGIEIIPAEEKNRLLYEFNDTTVEYPADKTLHELFAEQAERTPDNIAIIGVGTRFIASDSLERPIHLTYSELNQRSDQLALLLIEIGVRPDTIVPIMVERSLEMIIGLLAIIKAGGAYLPIDPGFPRERLKYMLMDSGAGILLTTPKLRVKVEPGIEEKDEQPQEMPLEFINLEAYPGDAPEVSSSTLTSSRWAASANNLVYVIYTSGSTGRPKGVMIRHHSLINRLKWMQKQFPLGPGDTILQKTPFTFDVSVWEIFWWAIVGASLCLLTPGGEKDPAAIVDAIEKNNIAVMHFVPSMLSAFLEYIKNTVNVKKLSSLKQVIASGEALLPDQVKLFNELLFPGNHTQLANLYGPTEATVDVSFYDCSKRKDLEVIPIGKPIDNIELLVINKDNQLQPIGVTGELCIRGAGLARGYLNRPQLTAEKFDQDLLDSWDYHDGYHRSYRSYPSYILYKTGDLARWLSGGNIEFLGRLDHQVKIRGFRIELQEIEKQLLNHEAIKETVVIAIASTNPGDNYLCSYIVLHSSHSTCSSKSLREYLSNSLPDYMIPSYFVQVKRIPLTPNGKLDRKALPAPVITGEEKYTAPRNPLEQKLVEIWSEVLAKDGGHLEIGIDDSFFELGGHSLKATFLISKLHKKLDMKIPLLEIFKRKTIRRLSEYIKEARETTYTDIEPSEKKSFYELSYNQKRLWIIHQMAPNSTAYHMKEIIPLNYEADIRVIETTISKIFSRHESLRTGFKEINDEAFQFIREHVDITIPVEDVSNLDDNEKKLKTREIVAEITEKPFDLEKPPLFRAALVKQAKESFVFVYNMHHIISDGWSMEVLKREFQHFYECYSKRKELDLPPLALQYKDFAAWNNRQIQDPGYKEKVYRHWRKKLQTDLPTLKLPYSYRGSHADKSGASFTHVMTQDIKDRLIRLSQKNHTTLFMVMFAMYHLLLAYICGQEEVLSVVISGGRWHVPLQPVIGYFVNPIIIKTRVDLDGDFDVLLKNITGDVLESFQYQDYPFELTAEELDFKSPNVSNSFNMLNIQDASTQIELGSLESFHRASIQDVKFDLSLFLIEYKNGIELRWNYRKSLFTPDTIENMAQSYIELMDEITDSQDGNVK
jgi:amino acid adenylation domain-containing protein